MTWIILLHLLLFISFPPFNAQRAASNAYSVSWLAPTVEDSADFFIGGMPLGNGAVQVLAWANTSAGGVSLYISHTDAAHSDTSQYKVALLTLSLSPNPFAAGSFFNQTLDIATATLALALGGTRASPAASLEVWVDAHSNTVYATASSSAPSTFAVDLLPIRPAGYPPHVSPWHCTPCSSAPDVVAGDPLPPGAFPSPNTIALLHANTAADFSTPYIPLLLRAQGLPPSLAATIPDLFTGRMFGVGMDSLQGPAGTCGALRRTSPLRLSGAAPSPCAVLRIAVLSTQACATEAAFFAALGAQLAAQPPVPPRALHEAHWRGFWTRSFVDASVPAAPAAPPPQLPTGATLRLRADTLQLANGSAVAVWPDVDSAPPRLVLSQPNSSSRPMFAAAGLGNGRPGVVFSQARRTHLVAGNASLHAGEGATVLAVFREQGSSGGAPKPCCSGVVTWLGSYAGLAVSPSASGGSDDDGLGPSDDPAAPGASALGDFSGSNLYSAGSVRGRLVVAAVVYDGGSSGGVRLSLDGCAAGTAALQGGLPASLGVMVGSRGADEYLRDFEGVLGEVVTYPRALSEQELAAAVGYLAGAWGVALRPCAAAPDAGFRVSQTYAMSRYMNNLQSGGLLPVKFNGLSWTSRRPGAPTACFKPGEGPNLGPDCRQWGADNWW